MIPYTRQARKAITRTWPGGSSRRARAARESGSTRRPKMIAATPGRTVIQNTERHPRAAASAPPIASPAAMPRPNVPVQTPIARARSAGSVNVAVMMPSDIGVSAAPPAPCSPRNAINQPTPGAKLHPSEASAYTASPAWKTIRRPNRSPTEPAVSIRLAVVIVYAAIVHCSPETGVRRPRPINGRARFTTVVSTAIMNRLAPHTATTAARLARPGGPAALTPAKIIVPLPERAGGAVAARSIRRAPGDGPRRARPVRKCAKHIIRD